MYIRKLDIAKEKGEECKKRVNITMIFKKQ